MGYAVATDVFEGPFDLLLRLITAEEVDVHEISLARIVDAYLAEMERMEALNLEVATEFLLIAATLVELKCRRLLPVPDLDTDDELQLLEERDLLLARLVECSTFALVARTLDSLARVAALSVPHAAFPDERLLDLHPDLLEGVTPEMIANAAMRAFADKPRPRVEVDHVLVDEVTVAEVLEDLCHAVRMVTRARFADLTRGLDRIGVIVRFLAVLELFKQGLVEIDQPTSFGDLVVTWTGGDREVDRDELSSVAEIAGQL